MDKKPDFRGTWLTLDGDHITKFRDPAVRREAVGLGHGEFMIYLNIRKPIENGNDKITGVIDDCFGSAVFQGTISKQEIRFNKQYLPDAVLRGGANSDITYEGKRMPNGMFRGTFRVHNQKARKEGYYDANFFLLEASDNETYDWFNLRRAVESTAPEVRN